MLEVVRAFVGAGALGGAVAVGTGAAADPGAHVAVLAGEDLGGLVFDPGAGGGVTGVEEAVRGLPQVVRHMNEAGQDGHLDLVVRGERADGLDRWLLPSTTANHGRR